MLRGKALRPIRYLALVGFADQPVRRARCAAPRLAGLRLVPQPDARRHRLARASFDALRVAVAARGRGSSRDVMQAQVLYNADNWPQ